MPGVMLQAHALSQILEGDEGPAHTALQSAVVTIVFAAVGAGIVVLGFPAGAKALALLVMVGIVWVGGFAIFSRGGMILPLVTPTLGLALSEGQVLDAVQVPQIPQQPRLFSWRGPGCWRYG